MVLASPGETAPPTTSESSTARTFSPCRSNPPPFRTGTGNFCQFKPNYYKQHDYTLDEIDLFAAYVIPVAVWYLIPAAVILKPKRIVGLMLHPVDKLRKNRYRYEDYREAWHLLAKSRDELSNRTSEKRRDM
jgi:hypothetical protein